MTSACRIVFVFCCVAGALTPRRGAAQATKNVVLVTVDGMRWQEVFAGADSALIAKESNEVRAAFWRTTPSARRAALLPFLWSTVAGNGILLGDRTIGGIVRVSNGRNVSYPGYNEILSGRVDPRIRNNTPGRNRNTTVLDWLQSKPQFSGRVAAYGAWETFNDIFNRERARFLVRAGWREPYTPARTAADSSIDRLYRSTRREFGDVAPDALLQQVVLNDLRAGTPRIMFVGYGATDEWAHAGRYDELLRAAHVVDSLVAELWSTLQSRAEYRGTTTMIITTDHGRGTTSATWRDHDSRTRGSDETWLAVIGPDTPVLGNVNNGRTIIAAQVAATLAALLGEDYVSAAPGAAPPIADVIRR